MSKSINNTLFIAHPPQAVWDYLTCPELLAQWLMENDIQPVVGHQFQFRMKPMPAMNLDGIINCTILEAVPMQRLSYSWKSGPDAGTVTLDSVVEWTLTAKDGGTELSLKHRGFEESESPLYNAMNSGWQGNMKKIEALIQNEKNAAAQS